jgi:hypothetical protein
MCSIIRTRMKTNVTRRSVNLVEHNIISILSTTCSLDHLCMAAYLMHIKLFVPSSWMKKIIVRKWHHVLKMETWPACPFAVDKTSKDNQNQY